jgi:predicted enzyme related to lactoylglutathione lyase
VPSHVPAARGVTASGVVAVSKVSTAMDRPNVKSGVPIRRWAMTGHPLLEEVTSATAGGTPTRWTCAGRCRPAIPMPRALDTLLTEGVMSTNVFTKPRTVSTSTNPRIDLGQLGPMRAKGGNVSGWRASVHHTHLMASDLDASLEFYRRWFDAVVVADIDYAGARNVFVAVGSGRLHFYDQPPRSTERNTLNHVGLVVDGLDALADAMVSAGVELPKGLQRFPDGNYLMV